MPHGRVLSKHGGIGILPCKEADGRQLGVEEFAYYRNTGLTLANVPKCARESVGIPLDSVWITYAYEPLQAQDKQAPTSKSQISALVRSCIATLT